MLPTPAPPAASSFLSGLTAACGLALALYLAALKLLLLPCATGLGDCGAVIHSRYGALLGVPVSFPAIVLWLGWIFLPSLRAQSACAYALALGAAVFLALQFFVVRAFCLYCTLHALASFAAVALPPPTLRRALPLFAALALAAIPVALGLRAPPAAALSSLAPLRAAALPWLGPATPGSPVLVLSFTCPACWERILAPLSEQSPPVARPAPALVLIKATPEDRDVTIALIAAVLAQSAPAPDALAVVATLAATQRDLIMTRPAEASALIRSLFPAAAARESAAAEILARHDAALAAAGIDTSPLLLRDGQPPSARPAFTELWAP